MSTCKVPGSVLGVGRQEGAGGTVVPTLRELASERGSKEQTHRQRSELSSDSDSYTEENKTGGSVGGWLLKSDSSGRVSAWRCRVIGDWNDEEKTVSQKYRRKCSKQKEQ